MPLLTLLAATVCVGHGVRAWSVSDPLPLLRCYWFSAIGVGRLLVDVGAVVGVRLDARMLGNNACRRRPYRVECTGSLPTSEVKRRRARLVLGWGTAWEHLRVLSAFASRREDSFHRPSNILLSRKPNKHGLAFPCPHSSRAVRVRVPSCGADACALSSLPCILPVAGWHRQAPAPRPRRSQGGIGKHQHRGRGGLLHVHAPPPM